VAEWLRVGYCQGNLNSDNSALGGVTLDYGPFAFMEKVDLRYNPWVGGGLPYSFGQQPQAIATNLVGVAQAFAAVVERAATADGLDDKEQHALLESVRRAVSHRFVDTFHTKHEDNCRAKLGLTAWDDEADELWKELMRLMISRSGTGGVDFTLFFRALSTTPPAAQAATDDDAATGNDAAANALLDAGGALSVSALQLPEDWPAEHRQEWSEWCHRYQERLAVEPRSAEERRSEMDRTNPKYILRNSMAAEAYEAAARGDFGILRELHEVLQRPYEEQGDEADARWAQPTPTWARGRPGLTYMS